MADPRSVTKATGTEIDTIATLVGAHRKCHKHRLADSVRVTAAGSATGIFRFEVRRIDFGRIDYS